MFDFGKDCGSCGLYKPRSQFNISRASADGRQSVCRNCQNEKMRLRYALDPEARKAENRKWKENNRARYLHRAAKTRAASAGIPFSITVEDVAVRLESGICELSGLPLSKVVAARSWDSPSLDQREAGGGYTPDNIRIIAWGLKAAFCDWGEEITAVLMRAWLERRV